MTRNFLAFLCVHAIFLLAGPLATAPAEGCLLADRLRILLPHASQEEIDALAHGNMEREVIPYNFGGPQPCINGVADIFPCDSVDLLGFLALSDIGGGNGNDLWGWTDSESGSEYALVGRTNGTAFVDLTNPEAPIYLGNLPTHNGENSTWRDIKVYQDHAYIVADNVPSHGLQIFDLKQLRNVANPPVVFTPTNRYTGFNSAHNIVINEDTGFAYAVGGDACSGGLEIVDLSDPANPVDGGCFSSDGYTHDAQCVVYKGPDTDHIGQEICFASNEDTVTVVDVTNKAAPVMLSRTGYQGSGYTHQGWMTEDHEYFVHDDEFDEINNGHMTRTYVWDMRDLDNPSVAGFTDADGAAIDHNQYIVGEHTYQANYTRGLRILELDDPSTGTLTEVAFFDTFPSQDGNGSAGAWSTYPFFDSGIVLVSDISRGLFIVQPQLNTRVFRDGFESNSTGEWTKTVN